MSKRKNTYESNVREFLPVEILNNTLDDSSVKEIQKICNTNKNDLEILKSNFQKMMTVLKSKSIDNVIIESLEKSTESDTLKAYAEAFSNVLKGIKTAIDVLPMCNDHPVAKTNKFSNLFKAYVINNEGTKKSLFGANASKLNPSDIVLVFNKGPIETLNNIDGSPIKGKYVMGVSLKSTNKKGGKTGFKNPGAIPFAKQMLIDIGGGSGKDYTNGKAKKFNTNMGKFINNVRKYVKILGAESDLALDTKGVIAKDIGDSQIKAYYKTTPKNVKANQSFKTLAMTMGRMCQSVLRDELFDIYDSCTKTPEGQKALLNHIFNYWFGVAELDPQYFVYEIKDTKINNVNEFTVEVFNWTTDNLGKMIGNGDLKVTRVALDSISIDTTNGTNVFDCRFKFGDRLGISSMKMSASSKFGEKVEAGKDTSVKPEYVSVFDATKNYTDSAEIAKIQKAMNVLSKKKVEESIDQTEYNYFKSKFGGSILRESKNTHIEHLEDMLFNAGVKGTREAINTARYVRDVLDGKVSNKNLSMKFDGSMSVVVGIDPSDNEFFVAKKSAFNKNPIVYKSVSDINRDDIKPELKRIFIDLYTLLNHKVSGVYQGDLLFGRGDKTIGTDMNGEKSIMFHPNTIVYSIPVSSKELYDRVNKAKIGIAWHTEYTGSSLEKLSARASNNIAPFFDSKDVFSIGSELKSEDVNLSESDKKQIDEKLSEIGKLFQSMKPATLNDISNDTQLKMLVKAFYNSKIKADTSIASIPKFVRELIEYINQKYQRDIDKLKTMTAKERTQAKRDEVLEYFEKTPKEEIEKLFKLFKLLSDVKIILIKQLNKIGGMNTFLKTRDGFKTTNQEGFVVADEEGNLIKLVDRLEFSKANFSPEFLKGWDR